MQSAPDLCVRGAFWWLVYSALTMKALPATAPPR